MSVGLAASEARSKRPLKLLVISTYPPKPCGIGTFTRDLLQGISAAEPLVDYRVVAIEDPDEHERYDTLVRQRIQKEEIDSLDRVATYCNACGADALSIQHEFGIWGGFDGELILHFLDQIRIPVVLTLHAVPLARSRFNRENRLRLVREIARRVSHLVTFVPEARDFLVTSGIAPADKVSVIWHGAPRFPAGRDKEAKRKLGLEGKLVVSSFGLLTRFKGLDYALRALPPLVEKYPDLHYLLLGQPHPVEPAWFFPGLRQLVADLGLSSHVHFVDHFLTEEEVGDYLAATDIYLTPYLDETQISSGTLTYALSAGKCIVSTSYVYARAALADGRGVLIPSADSTAIGAALDPLLAEPTSREVFGARARAFGENLAWPVVATQFLDVVRSVLSSNVAAGDTVHAGA